MRWWFCIPGVLVPAEVARHAVKALPDEIVRALCRANVDDLNAMPESPAPHLQWLWQRFGGDGEPVVAPYLWSMLSGESFTGEAVLWCCDPVHFALARDHMLVNALDPSATREQVAELMRLAGRIAAPEAASIVEQAGAWFLRTDSPWQLTTTPLDSALGRSLTECWPEGVDAGRWRKLMTEIQVEWHHHPINENRIEQGLSEVNGLWLHGGGSARPLTSSAIRHVVCDEPRLHAWAQAAGLPDQRQLANRPMPPADGDAVTLITDLLPTFNADDWGGWMQRWIALVSTLSAQIARAHAAGFDLTLQLFGRTHSRAITLAANDRWRLWRRADRKRATVLLSDAGT
jgi:hypothetical protein